MRNFPMHTRVVRYFGRRGGMLVLLGVAWIGLGSRYATVQEDRFSRPGPGGPLEFMDTLPLPGLFWVFCGFIALVNGFIRRLRNNDDAIGYAALVMPPLFWVFGFMTSFVQWIMTGDNPNPEDRFGQPDAYIGVIVYSVVGLVIWIIANWPCDLDVEYIASHKSDPGSQELALLDRMVETKDENDARGVRARDESELWIVRAREETERHIEDSATENKRMIDAYERERQIGRANDQHREGPNDAVS